MNSTHTTKAFEVRGMTDEITTCELCGREELRGTVQMIELDADGNPDRDLYFGTACAAKAAGWTQRDLKARIKAAETARREAGVREREARRDAENAAFEAYLLETYGTSDRQAVVERRGLRTAVPLLVEFDEYRTPQRAAGQTAVAALQLTFPGLPADAHQVALF
ncbi:hypothetical protein [Streptomyces sp. Da 82-17]|uniref:hypothetical protein n=1 Tax=Streptomyces sp. Da 82-17 TaxID=3377116 RepID=UPI0038D4F0E5